MLQAKYMYAENNCNNDLQLSRYKEIIQQYKDQIRAMVHRSIEVYIEEAFKEFIVDKIGIYVR